MEELSKSILALSPVVIGITIILCLIHLFTHKKKTPDETKSEDDEELLKCERCGSEDLDELGENDTGKETYKCERCGHIQYEEVESEDSKSNEAVNKPTSNKVEQPSTLSKKNQATSCDPKRK